MMSNGQPVIEGQFEDDDPGGEEVTPGDAAMMLPANGQAIQRVQTEFSSALAVQKPRVRRDVQKAVLEEAELAGEDFFYSWTTKNKDGTRGLVEGMSIEGAMIMARNWGNCAIPTSLVVDAPQHWVLCATFVDLETGFNVPRLFRQRKNQKTSGKMDAERALDIAFQIGQSKAQRNAIEKAMPNWLKEAALDKAKKAAEGRFKDVPAANAKAIAAFGKWGITQAQLEAKLGIPLEHWTARDHVSLSGLYRAIADRQTTIKDEFPAEPAAKPEPKPEDKSYGGEATAAAAATQPAAEERPGHSNKADTEPSEKPVEQAPAEQPKVDKAKK